MAEFIELEGISKTFPGLKANEDVNLKIKKAQVHALLGENGAGKSTLMKVLYGSYRADSGTIKVDGQAVTINSPADARAVGIGMVFQSFMLIPAFTVTENIALSLKELGLVIDKKEIEKGIREISDKYNFDVDPNAYVWQLSLGTQQKVEIIKLVMGGARLLIFDEPTSVLAPHEAEGLFKIFDGLRANGYSIIFISHKLNEVLACSDEITVLRRGKVVGTISRAEANEEVLVSMIIGAKMASSREYARKPLALDRKPILQLKDIVANNDRERIALDNMNLTIYAGEILGIAGVSGNGQKELGEVIQRLRLIKSGSIHFDGQEITQLSVSRVKQAGIACIPEDPLRQGAVGTMTVEENLALGDESSKDWLPMNWETARAKASYITDHFHLKMPRLNVPIQALSGGNVQRIVFAREMAANAKLLLAYYPTRGTDINAAEIIRTVLLNYRNAGGTILLVSEDLTELLSISDRLIVMYHGRNVGECQPENADINEIGHLMTDGKYAAHGQVA
ncbi:MAG: ATP-binding cassette domain-containing protein [Anaerolineaceae bacterium]|nr:ATP-binding cassette domain-containing protein [Anaerolineaceae bacterium]